MTDVKIIETGEIVTLAIIDPETGLDWSKDLLGNYDAYDDYGDEMDLMSASTYEWWAALLPRYQLATSAAHAYRKTLDGAALDSLLETLNHATDCDLENVPDAMLSAISQHRSTSR